MSAAYRGSLLDRSHPESRLSPQHDFKASLSLAGDGLWEEDAGATPSLQKRFPKALVDCVCLKRELGLFTGHNVNVFLKPTQQMIISRQNVKVVW